MVQMVEVHREAPEVHITLETCGAVGVEVVKCEDPASHGPACACGAGYTGPNFGPCAACEAGTMM